MYVYQNGLNSNEDVLSYELWTAGKALLAIDCVYWYTVQFLLLAMFNQPIYKVITIQQQSMLLQGI